MPAKSKAQQKAAGAALSAKRGDTPKDKLKGASKQMIDSMTEKQLDEFASTKRKGKPQHVADWSAQPHCGWSPSLETYLPRYGDAGAANDPEERTDIALLSEAVQRWYRFYELPLDEDASETLCGAAIGLYREGHRSVEEIATMLIGTYVGVPSTRVNAPTSHSLN
jgi:hypothetical protein